MEFVVKSTTVEKQKTGCLAIGITKKKLPASAATVDTLTQGYLSELLKRGDLDFKPGNSLVLLYTHNASFERLMLLALGEKNAPLSETDFRKVLGRLAGQLKTVQSKDITIAVDDIEVAEKSQQWVIRQIVEAIEYAFYQFTQFKSDSGKSITLKKVVLLTERKNTDEVKTGLAEGQAIGNGRNIARTLGNLPGNICHPTYLADEAKALAKCHAKLSTKILNEKQMSDLGMGSLLSVSAGSEQEARLICMEFKNGKRGAKPIVILGKGITFDTGGISLKPGASMDEMKFDMCGAASVFGVMNTIIELDLPLNVIGIVAAAENMPSGRATRPGDIVTSMSGKTIEVLNTDAEGRLVLCDALTYAERYKPELVVDIATLTGACVVALGKHTTGLLSNDDELAQALLTASNQAMDKAWQLPMGEEYTQQLNSNFADLANIGGPAGGTITAACFLSKFTEAYSWAHLDIAGTAWKSGKEKGATGRPVPMLVQFLMNRLDG